MPSPSSAEVAEVAGKLGAAQKRVVLSLTDDWGEAACHATAKRMFWGVGSKPHYLVRHKHQTDNCWMLSTFGLAVRAHLEGVRHAQP